jgi:hypothetical protein
LFLLVFLYNIEIMTVEAPSIPQVETLSATERVTSVDLEKLSPIAAGQLATEYFQEEYGIFEKRFVSIRDKVPADIATKLDEQAINYANIADSLRVGDARPLKLFVIESGMAINRQAQNNGGRHSTLGNSLYGLGARMSAIAEIKS